jgi:hypothetical protein
MLLIVGGANAFRTSSESRRPKIRKSSFLSIGSSLFRWATESTTTASPKQQKAVQDLLFLSRKYGPLGFKQPEEIQKQVRKAAEACRDDSTRNASPAKAPLTGVHSLVYSSSSGGSSGKVGPFAGKVTQTFVDDTTFVNAVELGPLRIALTAVREILSGDTVKVTFQKTTVTLAGVKLVEKDISGSGIWKVLYTGEVEDVDGTRKLVRVLNAPSLFVFEQPLKD